MRAVMSLLLCATLAGCCPAPRGPRLLPASQPVAARPLTGPQQGRVRLRIEARYEAGPHRITGLARLTIPFPGRVVALDLHAAGTDGPGPRLKIHQVLDDQGHALVTEVAGRFLRVTLPRAAREATLQVRFSTNLSKQEREEMGYALTWGRHWYPVLHQERPWTRRMDFDVTLSCPAGYAVLTTGRQVAAAEKPKNLKPSPSPSRRFVARGVNGFTVNLGQGFVVEELAGGKVAFFAPLDQAEIYRRAAKVTAEVVAWYVKTYGFFPLERIGLAAGHPRCQGGGPAPGLFYLHRGRLDPAFVRGMAAHELGHYYWGHHVLSAGVRELDWLMLANGIWIDQLYTAGHRGLDLAAQWRSLESDWYTRYMASTMGPRDHRLGVDVTTQQSYGNDYNMYVRHAKGAVGLHLQARRLGKDRFLALQRDLLRRYAHRPLSVADFCMELEKAGAAKACAFFQSWARPDASLGYRVTGVKPGDNGTYGVEVFRSGTVVYPVTVKAAGFKWSSTSAITGDKRVEVLELPGRPDGVWLDPEGLLPLTNSANAAIKRLYLAALHRAGHTEAFESLARIHLARRPGDRQIRWRLAGQLFGEGRFKDVATLLSRANAKPTDRAGCLCLLFRARAAVRLGQGGAAQKWLASGRTACSLMGLARSWGRAEQSVKKQP